MGFFVWKILGFWFRTFFLVPTKGWNQCFFGWYRDGSWLGWVIVWVKWFILWENGWFGLWRQFRIGGSWCSQGTFVSFTLAFLTWRIACRAECWRQDLMIMDWFWVGFWKLAWCWSQYSNLQSVIDSYVLWLMCSWATWLGVWLGSFWLGLKIVTAVFLDDYRSFFSYKLWKFANSILNSLILRKIWIIVKNI
jgi:hypothetical protein